MRMILSRQESRQPEGQTIDAPEGRTSAGRGRLARWIARFGVAGFLFFLIKGLAWLVVPAAIAAYAARS